MFEVPPSRLAQEAVSREFWARFENEITEEEWIQGLIEEQSQASDRRNTAALERDVNLLSDAEAIAELIDIEAAIARRYARRAELVALVAAQRPASADRPVGQPGANDPATEDVVPEVLDVSEWLAHELQMAHPYSWTAAQDLVDTSLVLSDRLSATLGLLAAGRIDYRRAHILTDLLGTCSTEVSHTVEAMVLSRAPELTPSGLARAIRRALTLVDASALRRRHARARRTADVAYWPTQDGMARLVADLPLPVAAACCDAVARYANAQQADGDDRPIGQVRTEVLTDLILRPWDASRPAVSAEVTIHLTIPARQRSTGGVEDEAADSEVDGQDISAAQCRELLGQLHSSRLFLALHSQNGGLRAVATGRQLSRAARRHGCGPNTDGIEGPGLRPPSDTSGYRPSAEQDRHVRTRDRTCRHFGCTRKAVHADLDHHRAWPDGPTSICNLCSYCRTHHRLKHQAPGWTRYLDADGTLTVSTPTGITRSTRPPGPEPQRRAAESVPIEDRPPF